MNAADATRESARQHDGKFDEHTRAEAEVALEACGPDLHDIEVRYGDGQTDVTTVGADGVLPNPHPSDSLVLNKLVGFSNKPFAKFITLHVDNALRRPKWAKGLTPVFEVVGGGNTSLRATVTGITKRGA